MLLNKKILGHFMIILIFGIMISSCNTAKKINHYNYSSEYAVDNINNHISFKTFHYSADSTKLFYNLNVKASDYAIIGQSEYYKASFQINIDILNNIEERKIIGQKTITIIDSCKRPTDVYIGGEINITQAKTSISILNIMLVNNNSNKSWTKILYIDKQLQAYNNSVILVNSNNKIVLDNYILAGNYHLKYNKEYQIDSIEINYYKGIYEIAQPPFYLSKAATPTSFDIYKPDSTFYIKANNGNSDNLHFSKNGFYTISINKDIVAQKVFKTGGEFPKIGDISQMLYPLRYLTSQKEFSNIMISANKKLAVDEFWINAAGTPSSAKRLIKDFYNRLETANILFTSYQEGWRTDMGLIFIIYGTPTYVIKDKYSEIWIYRAQKPYTQQNFVFYRNMNMLIDNQYYLRREYSYRDAWYRAIGYWNKPQ